MELLQVNEIATQLNVTEKTIYNYIKHRQLKAVKVGKRYLVRKADYETLLQKGTANNYLSI